MMDQNTLLEALSGLRAAHSSTPPPDAVASLQAAPSSAEMELTNEEIESDPQLRKRMSLVEDQLMAIFAKQSELEGQVPPVVNNDSGEESSLPIHMMHAYPCRDTHRALPSSPSRWPQAPVMLRPTPNTNTRIRGIRFADSAEYQHFKGFCAGCILPINTGAELTGKSLVIDFESKHFVGTLLMRIKEAPPNTKDCQSDTSYFDGKKRRFQAIVKGKFKTPLAYSTCVTGQIFDRPAGHLPARWIVQSFIKFVSTLAPQLQVTISGTTPKFLTPLCATAHTVLCKTQEEEDSMVQNAEADEKLKNYFIYKGSMDIETNVEEPSNTDPTSLLFTFPNKQPDNGKKPVTTRQKLRKKALNHNAASKSDEPTFQLDKEYTFEFYQHLLLFGDSFAVDMGSVIGKVNLAPCTDGQPLKFMAATKTDNEELDYLWSFDIWHESLYALAQAAFSDSNKGN
jgi:hypothetical protein